MMVIVRSTRLFGGRRSLLSASCASLSMFGDNVIMRGTGNRYKMFVECR
jgi:hypothetical protein